MGSLIFDQWSIINNYHAMNIAQPPTPTVPNGVVPSVILPQHMHNTMDVALGAHFKFNDQLLFRGSFRYEPTPTISQFRYVSFPDGEKLGINIGARYQLNKHVALDALYAHVFVRTVTIHDVNPLTFATASGRQRTSIDLLGGQIVFSV
jgi:long-subunit fatty acid transport protein